MSKVVDNALREFFDFLAQYKFDELLTDKPYKASVRVVYRRYPPLLVWQACLADGDLWPTNAAKDNEFRLYFNEAVSDVCHSFLLFCHGMYKPSGLVLRSGIEAFVKSIGLAGDQKILTIKSLYEVFDIVSDLDIIKDNPLTARSFRTLHINYVELCKYVHIAGVPYMSLSSLAGNFPSFNQNRSKEIEKIIQSTVVSICSILGILFNARYKRLHHSSIDLISDILPKLARQEIMSSTSSSI